MTVPNSRSGYGRDARDARNGRGGCSSSRSRGMGPSSYFMGGIIVRCYCGCCNSLSAMRSLSFSPFFRFYYFFRPNQHGNKIKGHNLGKCQVYFRIEFQKTTMPSQWERESPISVMPIDRAGSPPIYKRELFAT